MRIAAIHMHGRDLEVAGEPYRMARTAVDTLATTLVQVVADNGTCGWGETCPVGPVYQPHHALGARAALHEIAPALIGRDPLSIGPNRTAMDARLDGHDYAKAAIDIALHDLAGKHYGVRVCDLLGGARVETVPSYFATGVGDPSATARIAADKAAQGFPRIQVKLGGRPVEADIETIRAVADTVGGRVRLIADANRGWTARDAVLASNAWADIPLTFEQPCNTLEEIGTIRPQLCHPVFLDESAIDLPAVLRAIATGVCDGFGFKVTRAGGVSAMPALRDVCAARSMPHTVDDAWGGDVIAAACVHVAATVTPERLEGVWIAQPYIEDHYDANGGIRIRDGHIDVPGGPGLGLDIDPAQFGDPVASWS